MKPRVYAQGQYNDNIFLSDRTFEEDFITTISSGVDIEYTTPTEEIDLEYEYRHSFFTELPEPDFSVHRGRINMGKDFGSRFRAGVRNNFIRSEDPIELMDIDIFERPYFRNWRKYEPYMRNIVDPYLTVRFGEGRGIRLGYRNHMLRDDAINVADRDQNDLNVRLLLRLNSSHGLDLFARYQETDYGSTVPSRINRDFKGYDGQGKYSYFFNRRTSVFLSYRYYARAFVTSSAGIIDYAVHEPRIGVESELYEGVSFSAGGGYSIRDSDEADDSQVISARIDLSCEKEQMTFDGYFEIGFSEDFLNPELLGFYEFWRMGFRGRFELTEALLIEEACYSQWDRYTDNDRIDRVLGVQGVVSYRVLSWLVISVDYLFAKRESNTPFASFRNNRISARITLDREFTAR